jgi:hypothetical protein
MRKPEADPGEGISWIEKNKTKIVVGIWGTVLAGSLVYNFRRPDIAKSQKIINSRMVAQASVLGGMGLMGASELISPSIVSTKPVWKGREF